MKGALSMLVLSRKIDEEIIINRNIAIKIVDIRGQVVRIGITAPSNVSIHRKEIQDIINAQSEGANT